MPRDSGWEVAASVTTSGALATGISYLNEEEKLALSLRVGTYQNETIGLAVGTLKLPFGQE